MAPALTAEPLSTKEKLTSVASPSVVVKKPSTPTPATATTRVTRSSKEAAATAAAAAKAAAVVPPQRVPSSRISNNKRKLSGGNNSSSTKLHKNDPMGLSTAPTPHTTATTSAGSVVAETETEAATGGGVPPIIDAAVASTSATGLLESQSPALQQSDSPPSTDAPAAVAPSSIENNNNNSSCSSPSKDNSTAQLLADLNSDFVETISAEICLRKTLPEVSLSKEPAPSAVALTGAEEAVAVAETLAQIEAAVEAVTGESTTGVSVPQIDLLKSMGLEQTVATTKPLEELPKIDTDNIEERLSQLDGNASSILVELPSVQLGHEQVQVEVVIPPTPTTPSRQQLQQDPRSEPLPAILASPLPGQRQTTAASALSASQLTPQSTSSSTNFLKDATAGVTLEDPDIEEVLKALKTFEGNHVINPDINQDMCDFNFFNEVWEEAPPATAVAQRSITPQYPSNSIVGGSSVVSPHVLPAETMAESQKSMEQQQQILTRKMDHLCRRMRKFQARYQCSHTSEEVAGIMEWAARTSHKTPNPVRSDKLSEQETTVQSIVSGRPRPDFWEEQKKHPVPASQMASILRSIATAARHQQICHTPSGSSATLAPSSTWYNSASSAPAVPAKARRGKNQLDTSATAASTSTAAAAATATEQKTPGLHEIIPCFDTHITNELTHVSGLLHNEMREIQNAIDSDATESSSGGESADEMVIYNNTQQKPLTIARRAVWTYSKDRANIALRWSWLCSQMADLEGRKRQYRDLHMDLNHAKGAVELEPMQVQQPANGYKEEQSSEWQCTRARPLMLSKFRKRSLFQTTGIHTISKKAARPSNIKCGCQWPQIPCALCTGRPDPTAPRELAEMMMPANRVALLDPGYHPVLSFDTDVTQSVHFEAISRQADWQHRVSRCQAKTVVKGVYKAEREAIAASNSAARRPGDLIKRRYIRRKERNNNNNNNNSNSNKDATAAATTAAAAAAATGLGDSGNAAASRKQQTQPPTGTNGSSTSWPDSRQRQRQRHHSPSSAATATQISNSVAKRRRISKNSSTSNSNTLNNSHLNGYSDQSGGGDLRSRSRSRHASPTHNQRTERTTERRHRPVYDIDNIVIPYSIAAQTKVEILPYKEIPTPKWRVVDSETDKKTPVEPAAASSSDDSTAPPPPPPLTPTPTKIKVGGNGIVPALAAATSAASVALNEQKPQPQSVPGQPSKVNGLKKLQQQKTKRNINNNNNGLVNGNVRRQKDVLLKAKASEQKEIAPQLVDSEKKKAVLQVLDAQAETNDRKEDILSAVGLENDVQSLLATDKKDIQSSVSDKKDLQSNASDKKDIQSTASDQKVVPQSKASDQKDIQSSVSDKKDIQSTASDKKDIKSKGSDKKDNKSKGSDKKDIKSKGSDKKHIKSKARDQKKIKSSVSDKKKIKSSGSDKKKTKSTASDQRDVPQSKASRKKSARSKKKRQKRKKQRHNGKTSKATATATKEAATDTAAAGGATKVEANSKPHLIEGVRIATVEPMAKRPKLQLAKAGDGDKPKTNGGQPIPPIVQLDPEEDEDDEDTSDEAYIVRHQLALIEERQRFETYLKFPWSTRPRANRRVDSRAESSGANTPDSASPAPHLAGGGGAAAGDNESIPSPLAHPLEGFNENGEMVAAKARPQTRRRTTSSKLKDQTERRSATPDIKDTFVEPSPFEPLTFPLSEEVYQKMLAERYAPPKYEVLKPEVKRTKSKSTSSNGDGGSAGAGKSKRRSSKSKTKLVHGQQNGHLTADADEATSSSSTAKINGGGGGVGTEEELEEEMDDGVDYDPEPEDMMLEELEEDYPKHHLAPLDDDEMVQGGDDLYNSAIDAYLGDPEALEEDMADDPFGDDDPNDPEWKTRSDGSRKRV